ncbi:hypothetical protein ACSBLW_10050 [Thioclava sp. FR2]|uniref:hypothetical protein n=1 Tax=Thioclava sp. FR2 TaxID=3445780 RepID=UPI003EBA52B0
MIRGLAVFLLLASCVMPVTKDGQPVSRLDCVAKGGSVSGMHGQACVMPTADAGKSCSRASDCSGVCMAETRTCSAKDAVFGCYSFLNEKGEVVSLCAD